MPVDTGKGKGRFIETSGLRLHYVEWGSSGAQPLLLLHGLKDCARSWDRFAAALSANYLVVALDQRGHGDSDWAPPGSYRLQDFVSDVEALVYRMALDSVVLLGHGAGGRHAVAYAATHPEKVETLIVVDSDLDAADSDSRDLGPSASGQEEWDSVEAVVEHLRGLQPSSTAETLAHQASCLTREITGGRRAWKRDPAMSASYEQPDLLEEWRKVKCPTLVARGRQSDVLSHQEAVKMRESFSRARIAELDGGGHWFHQEIPGAFEATVRWFLQDPPT